MFDYRGLTRMSPIASCVLSIQDLQRLYRELDAKAQQAMEKHLAALKRAPDTSEEEWDALLAEGRRVGHVTVSVLGSRGEQIMASSIEALDPTGLPAQIQQITFDSAAGPKQAYNIFMMNRFVVELDFTEPPGFNSYNPWDQPTPNASRVEVIGADDTWVLGVYESILGFFTHRQKKRTWLHSSEAFNLLNWFVGFPVALWTIFRVDSAADFLQGAHPALKGAFYVYLFLVVLLLFRAVIWAARWLFPMVELEEARSTRARAVFWVVVGGLITGLLYDVLKTVLT
ncbi:MAG: hypothetical protein KY467_00520 [Gemmatimonadetes bacterium]|nr:hypothetical protein [Gemmatimonadota bacterium]